MRREEADAAAEGVFVVVVVGSADNKGGGNRRAVRRFLSARRERERMAQTSPEPHPRSLRSRAPRQPHKALHAKARGKDGMPDLVIDAVVKMRSSLLMEQTLKPV
ncbi:MAG: hypothetical protein JNJ78_09000 [Anaerolineae bacterium]|nr:hypothetical protein [Anaerolineae bacterium]